MMVLTPGTYALHVLASAVFFATPVMVKLMETSWMAAAGVFTIMAVMALYFLEQANSKNSARQ